MEMENKFNAKYMTALNFSKLENMPVELVIKMIREGVYRGLFKDNTWFISREEHTEVNGIKINHNYLNTSPSFTEEGSSGNIKYDSMYAAIQKNTFWCFGPTPLQVLSKGILDEQVSEPYLIVFVISLFATLLISSYVIGEVTEHRLSNNITSHGPGFFLPIFGTIWFVLTFILSDLFVNTLIYL